LQVKAASGAGFGRAKGRGFVPAGVRWFVALSVTMVIVLLSYVWVDRPIATYVHVQNIRPHHALLELLTRLPDPLIPLAAVAVVILGLRAVARRSRPLPTWQVVGFLCSVSVLLAEAIKDQLKFVFGRTWPEAWAPHDPAFIETGAYGFNWLHGGAAYQSFPSGHMGATCAVVSVLWSVYPQWRFYWALCALGVAAALVGGNYHFLSDVIAGAFVGGSTGWMTTLAWRAWLSRRRRKYHGNAERLERCTAR
jgi:membrane-associated phospholipid phosphatase